MKYASPLLICLLVFSAGFAEESVVTPGSRSLNEQYRALSAECDLIDGFRMMKLYKMDQLWKAVQDSVHKKQADINELKSLTANRDNEIKALKTSLSKSNAEQASLANAVDNLIVFGKGYSKAGFISATAVVLIALVALAVMLLLMYRVAFGNAHEFKKLNKALNAEFDEYKHQAIEKQIKISRELQDYRNRLEELKVSKSF